MSLSDTGPEPSPTTSAASLLLQAKSPSPRKAFRYSIAKDDIPPSPPIASGSTSPPQTRLDTVGSSTRRSDTRPEAVETQVASLVKKDEGINVEPLGAGIPSLKGKEKEIVNGVDESGPSKSLLNRLSGPSDQKAGLNKRNKEEVSKIIYEASKNSSYLRNEQRKDQELSVKVEALVSKVEKLVLEKQGNLSKEEGLVDEMLNDLEKTRDLTQNVMVVDADAFYASCHELINPELRGTAFVVGGGVVCTASYEARTFGCRSAMAGFVAKKLCPHVKFVDLDFSLYTRISAQIMDILRQYGEISPASLDEAYCSLTEYCEANGVTPAEAAERMRLQIKTETGCTVSAGASPNALISKIAADLNKPDGQCVVDPTPEACKAFMRDLPIRKVPGIGRVTERWLQGLGIESVGDIYRLRGKLFLVRDEIGLGFLLRTYLGLGVTEIKPADRSERKNVSVEQTYGSMSELSEMCSKLKELADSLAGDLAKDQYSGRTLSLKIKLDTFEVIQRSRTLGSNVYFSDSATLYREGKKLLEKEIEERRKDFAQGKKVKGDTGKTVWSIKAETPDTKPTIKLEAEDTGGKFDREEALRPDLIKMPSSSDPLWATIDGPDWNDDFLLAAAEEDLKPPQQDRHKPFWTAGPSLNSKATLEAPVAEENRLSFRENKKMKTIECPVCGIAFLGSEVALAGHVESHFEIDTNMVPVSKAKKRLAPPLNGDSKKLKKAGTLASFW